MFGGESSAAEPTIDLKALHARIGQLALENSFLESALIKRRHGERKAMIDRRHDLSIRCQAELMNISRGSAYYTAVPVSDGELKLMRRINELRLELPFARTRMLRDPLQGEGVAVGRKRMTTLMRHMGITALYRKPNPSKKASGHKIYPYLLRTPAIKQANQA